MTTTAMTTTAGKSELSALLNQSQARFAEVAPKWMSVERLVRLMLAARGRSPAIAECTATSVLAFCMRCAETGLEPIGAGGAWPVPYRNKNGTREIQFIPDWRGLIFLAKQSGAIKHAYGDVVRQGDVIEYVKGDSPSLTHKPSLTGGGDIIGAYCVAILPDGEKHIEYMPAVELDSIRRRSKACNDGPWVTDYAAMCIKTVVKRAMKPFASSPRMQTAIDLDNQATGLLSLQDRVPIAEPREVGAPSAPHPSSAPAEAVEPDPAPGGGDDTPKEGSEAPAPTGAAPTSDIPTTVITGVIEDYKRKQVGKRWRTAILVGGEWYSTLDRDLGNEAVVLKGKRVDLEWEYDESGKYRNFTGVIGVIEADNGPDSGAGIPPANPSMTDDLPWK
jgi:recombination protein RecT